MKTIRFKTFLYEDGTYGFGPDPVLGGFVQIGYSTEENAKKSAKKLADKINNLIMEDELNIQDAFLEIDLEETF